MIKLLIVDDESTTRKGLVKHIPWSELGIHLVEEAKDGVEALEIAGKIHPDIVLSDIRMPGINGIELAKELREQFPNCKIIFLSGYSDKEYLKAAIKLSAVNYVEKPINLLEVKDAVEKAVELCINDEKRILTEKNINTVISENLPFMKQKIVTNLIGAEADYEESLRELNLMNIHFDYDSSFNIMIIKLFGEKEQTNEEIQLNHYKLLGIVDEALSDETHISAYTDNSQIVVILSSNTTEYRNRLTKVFEAIKKEIKEQNIRDINLFCSVSRKVYGIDKLSEAYRTAAVNLKKLFFYGYNNIIFYESNIEETYFIDESIHTKFTQCLSEQNELQAITLIEELGRDIKKHNTTPVNYVKNIFFKLAFQMFMEAEKRGVYFSEAGENEENYLWDLISSFQTLQEIMTYITNKIASVFKRIEELESSCRTVFQVKKHIQKSFGDESLSTKTLADQVYLTPAYLSALFKKETGKTISEYIIEIRIEKSKDYLKDSKLKLFEVAKNVGYNDANYYAKAFKKLIGVTPSEYREKYL